MGNKKIKLTNNIKAHVDYTGAVEIVYFDVIQGKKVINAYNSAKPQLFKSLVKFLAGDSNNSIPSKIDLYVKENEQYQSALIISIPYLTSPLILKATLNGDTYTYENTDSDCNCIGFSFIIPKGSFKTNLTQTETKISKLGLLDSEGQSFAELELSENEQINIDNTSNIQIYWRLIFS